MRDQACQLPSVHPSAARSLSAYCVMKAYSKKIATTFVNELVFVLDLSCHQSNNSSSICKPQLQCATLSNSCPDTGKALVRTRLASRSRVKRGITPIETSEDMVPHGTQSLDMSDRSQMRRYGVAGRPGTNLRMEVDKRENPDNQEDEL